MNIWESIWVIVSVPFPGILFLNPFIGFMVPIYRRQSFRPLPGDLISQLKVDKLILIYQLFPSPSGGFLFLNDIECNCEDREDAVSVPFPGILFLNLTDVDGQLGVISFPSPSRGSYFSIISRAAHTGSFRISFPSPSRGSYFSIAFLPKSALFRHVSVPFPGILFLNPVLYMPNLNWIPKPNCGAKPNPTLE